MEGSMSHGKIDLLKTVSRWKDNRHCQKACEIEVINFLSEFKLIMPVPRARSALIHQVVALVRFRSSSSPRVALVVRFRSYCTWHPRCLSCASLWSL